MQISNSDWLTWFEFLEQIMNSDMSVQEKHSEVFKSGISTELSSHYLWTWVNLKVNPEADLNSFWQSARSVKRQINEVETQLIAA